MRNHNQKFKKALLLLVIFCSYFPIAYARALDIGQFYNISIASAYFGFITLWWAYVLGIKRLIGRFISDIKWTYWLHKWLNILGFVAILAHPVVILTQIYGITLLFPKEITEFQLRVSLGSITLLVWAVIWFTSAILRDKMKFRPWKRIHLLGYVLFFLAFQHLQIGIVFSSYPVIEFYFKFLFLTYLLLIAWQLVGRLGILRSKYKVIETIKRTHNVTTIVMKHQSGKKLAVKPSQYIYIQRKPAGETHPFSISGLDNDKGQIEVTIKASGKFSTDAQGIAEGDLLIIDGPYGKFLSGIESTPQEKVFVAGGIGITPFISKLNELARINYSSKVWLFYGNRTRDDISFDKQLLKIAAKVPGLKIVHVLSEDQTFEGEKGYLSPEIFKKYIGLEKFAEADYYLCGPPIMIDKLIPAILAETNKPGNIYTETFST